MMNWIAGNWTEPFKCLVSHAGIFDTARMALHRPRSCGSTSGSTAAPPFEVPENYEKHNPVNHVAHWSKPMLVIHGQLDYRVPYTQGIATFTALQRRGIPSRLLIFPNENHWVLKPANSIQWHREVEKWLDQWTAAQSKARNDMRLSRPRLAPLPPSEWNDEQRELLTRGNPPRVLNVFATLIRHQDLYRRWMPFANHVLFKSTLPPREREMAILRVGWLCRSGLRIPSAHAHRQAGRPQRCGDRAPQERARRAGWTEAESALLRAVDDLHGDQFIGDATWQRLGKHYDTRPDHRSRVRSRAVHDGVDGAQLVRRADRGSDERDASAIPATDLDAAGGDEAARAGRGRLAGRRILVVGAGTQPCDDPDAPLGNGRAISILCAREGAAVACADRDEAAARDTLQRIASEGNRAAVVVADVTDEAACAQLVADAEAALGGLDGIVVNVGIGYGRGLEGTDARAWDLTFAINLRAHFLIARAALPRLQPGAALVFVSSIAAHQARHGHSGV